MQAVLFDLDGTLISTDVMANRMLEVLIQRHRNGPFPDEIRRSFRGMPTRQILAHIDPERVDELLLECVELQNEYRELSHLFPGIYETLNALQEADIRLGVITAQAAPEMNAMRKHFPLDEFIQVWVSADDVLNPKPNPEPIHKVLEILDVTTQSTLFVGDSHYDIQAGKRAGVQTGAALWGRRDPQELFILEPDHAFQHPEEIQELCLR